MLQSFFLKKPQAGGKAFENKYFLEHLRTAGHTGIPGCSTSDAVHWTLEAER